MKRIRRVRIRLRRKREFKERYSSTFLVGFILGVILRLRRIREVNPVLSALFRLRRKSEPRVERSSTTGNTTLSKKDGVERSVLIPRFAGFDGA